jgi:hypothetical protein
MTACAPPNTKPGGTGQNVVIVDNATLNIDRLKPVTVSVDAIKPWQNAGIFVENGQLLHVSASGKWSTWPEMGLWSGPEGSSLWGNELSGGALIARLGHDGNPFEIGVTRTFRAQDYGMLYFRINDADNDLFNNQGSVEAQVYISGGKQQTEQGASGIKVVAYEYNDATRKGSMSATAKGDQFTLRNWMLNKIGEIASSKNVAIKAGEEPLKGGNYTVLDESITDGVMTIEFKAEW